MTPKLKKALQLYSNWLADGAPHDQPFRRDLGLCTNFYLQFDTQVSEDLKHYLTVCFTNTTYPFSATFREYDIETESLKAHLNPRRIAWVKKMLE